EVRPDGGPHEAGFLKLDCGKLKRTFGWEARWHIDRAIQETGRWSKAWLLAADIREVTDQQIVSFFLG
ncbi:MAG: CDP-glucose 4,6-dehydratase, partial [Lachnospiraceae bacterium]